MRILTLEPYYGGSHRAFLDGWSQVTRHEWSILSLPAYKWKWRMRHAAVTFAQQVERECAGGARWDLLLCSDMLNLAEFRGLAPRPIRDLPGIVYFHENQLTYPVQCENERDYQFAITNLTTAFAADAVWFNSAFHRDSFLTALAVLLNRMPDHQPFEAIERVRARSEVHPPGVGVGLGRSTRAPGPMRILWAARWEHDKNPEDFFAAVAGLRNRHIPFRLSVVGEQFREVPEVFSDARRLLADHIDRWGYQRERTDYEAALREADVFVSTARHEFFGLSAVEASLAGAYPLVPNRLAYPEIFSPAHNAGAGEFLYDGSVKDLTVRLIDLATRLEREGSLLGPTESLRDRLRRFEWPNLAPSLDATVERIATGHKP
jgi:glycosyltransferase involved in cell wall biosynthesis